MGTDQSIETLTKSDLGLFRIHKEHSEIREMSQTEHSIRHTPHCVRLS